LYPAASAKNYVALMKDLIARTRELFNEGLPLAEQVEGKLSVDLEMFSRGGLAVLDAIEEQGYDTLNRRPAISKAKQAGPFGPCFTRSGFLAQAPRRRTAKHRHAGFADC
jgi:phytoene/squalene synthetase